MGAAATAPSACTAGFISPSRPPVSPARSLQYANPNLDYPTSAALEEAFLVDNLHSSLQQLHVSRQHGRPSGSSSSTAGLSTSTYHMRKLPSPGGFSPAHSAYSGLPSPVGGFAPALSAHDRLQHSPRAGSPFLPFAGGFLPHGSGGGFWPPPPHLTVAHVLEDHVQQQRHLREKQAQELSMLTQQLLWRQQHHVPSPQPSGETASSTAPS